MKVNYKNWVPKSMIWELVAANVVVAALFVLFGVTTLVFSGTLRIVFFVVLLIALLALLKTLQWSISAYKAFSYDGTRQLSKQIIEGTAKYMDLPEGGKCMDVGCGSGALAIAVAKRNPKATVYGVDRWGKEYASFSDTLCAQNAEAEGVSNVQFAKGDAVKLDFPDEFFDGVVSNYVYHNVTGKNKQDLLLETLRTLKKGGTFAIHDLMSKRRYGDMIAFREKLLSMGYQDVRMIDTASGMFMSRGEAAKYGLTGSTLLVGRK